jgi:type IV fimbrial biogenesis protein FimT
MVSTMPKTHLLPLARRAPTCAPRHTRGFTLTELMIVVAVFAVLVMAALPSYNQFVRNQRVKTASFEVFSSLVLARSEAITRNAPVTMAPVSGNWANGWTVTAASGTVLRQQEALAAVTVSGPASVIYNGSGRLGSAAGSFELNATGTGITVRCITLDLSGRPVTKASAC